MDNPAGSQAYPYATLSIERPQRSNRLTAFFRLFAALPILFLLMLLLGFASQDGDTKQSEIVIGGGFLFLPLAVTLLFRHRYPRVWFDWIQYLSKFSMRVCAYLLLLRDEYPAIEEEQKVSLALRYPDARAELGRGMPLVKWFLALPHLLVLAILMAAAIVVTVVAWFAILFTGAYPAGLHRFVVGVLRWGMRVNAYAFLLLTDRYPPFALS